jgi:TRAP-type uncharacterized transport system fused permease subunit
LLAALIREGARHRPGGAWSVLIAAGSVAAAIYVLWIGALATIVGDAALDIVNVLKGQDIAVPWLDSFATWARAFTVRYHIDISVFIAVTFPIAFLTTSASHTRRTLHWTDVALAAISFAIAMHYIVDADRFLNWSRGFSRPTLADTIAGFTLVALVIELCRRATGWGLTSLVVVLLAYTFFGDLLPGALKHENYTEPYFIEMMTISRWRWRQATPSYSYCSAAFSSEPAAAGFSSTLPARSPGACAVGRPRPA